MDQVYGSSAMQQMVASAAISRHQENCYSNSSYGEEHACMRDPIFFQPIHPAFTGGIESYLDPKYAADPTAFASRLPYFPFSSAYGMYEYGFEPAFIRKRNERERQRVKCVNDGYARLREHLPDEYTEKRLSKVETLRGAIQYIKHLQKILGVNKDNSNTAKNDEKRIAQSKVDPKPEQQPDGEEKKSVSNESRTSAARFSEQASESLCSKTLETEDISDSQIKTEIFSSASDAAESPQPRTIPTACIYESCSYDTESKRTVCCNGAAHVSEKTQNEHFRSAHLYKQHPKECLLKDCSSSAVQRDRIDHLRQDSSEEMDDPGRTACYYNGKKGTQRCPSYGELGTQDVRFNPYDRRKESVHCGRDFTTYGNQRELQLKQENAAYNSCCQDSSLNLANFLQSRYRSFYNIDYYTHSSSFESSFRCYGRGAESDGFKSDYSPGSSSLGTSP